MSNATPKLPSSVLFVCTLNSIRSPMAEGIMKKLYGADIYIQSCGLEAGELNDLMVSVMGEKGIDMSDHSSKSLDDLGDMSFDVAIAFTQDVAEALKAVFVDADTQIDIWPTPDPTAGDLNVRAMMDNYRAVRDTIMQRIKRKFG